MSRLERATRSLREIAPVDLALRLTLLDLLLRPIGEWQIRPAILALAGAGLLIPGWLRRPPLWFALAGLTALRFWIDWPLADNHAYLISYWCLAVGISLVVRDTEACLALNGRLLIGLAFAFAVLWKGVLSPDFMNGTFLRVTMLQDPRFEDWTLLSTGLSADQLEIQHAALDRHLDSRLLRGGARSGVVGALFVDRGRDDVLDGRDRIGVGGGLSLVEGRRAFTRASRAADCLLRDDVCGRHRRGLWLVADIDGGCAMRPAARQDEGSLHRELCADTGLPRGAVGTASRRRHRSGRTLAGESFGFTCGVARP